MKTWITSDLHFGHANIMTYEAVARARFMRPEDMDDIMIEEWNDIVSPEDDVYILGDFAFRSAQAATEILIKLNGNKFLVPGNHDTKLLESQMFRGEITVLPSIYEMTYEMPCLAGVPTKGLNRQKIVMCHYPIAEWNGCHRGAVHFYGHLHSNKIGGEFDELRTLNVGMDATGRIVIPMEEAIETARKGRVKGHHE